MCPLNWIDKSPGSVMMKATYEECARDKLDDRTATCICKVLKLERWVLFHASLWEFAVRR